MDKLFIQKEIISVIDLSYGQFIIGVSVDIVRQGEWHIIAEFTGVFVYCVMPIACKEEIKLLHRVHVFAPLKAITFIHFAFNKPDRGFYFEASVLINYNRKE